MFTEEDGAGETAISYTDQFVDAGIAKLDDRFGKGYAEKNPQALAAYIAASASNLNAFMTAAMAMQGAALDEAFATLEEEIELRPTPKPKGKRR